MRLYRTLPKSQQCEHRLLAIISDLNTLDIYQSHEMREFVTGYETGSNKLAVDIVNEILKLKTMHNKFCVYNYLQRYLQFIMVNTKVRIGEIYPLALVEDNLDVNTVKTLLTKYLDNLTKLYMKDKIKFKHIPFCKHDKLNNCRQGDTV
jgi:hypothetical protein